MQLFLIILASIMTATLNAQALSKSKIFFPFAEYGKAPFYAEVVGHDPLNNTVMAVDFHWNDPAPWAWNEAITITAGPATFGHGSDPSAWLPHADCKVTKDVAAHCTYTTQTITSTSCDAAPTYQTPCTFGSCEGRKRQVDVLVNSCETTSIVTYYAEYTGRAEFTEVEVTITAAIPTTVDDSDLALVAITSPPAATGPIPGSASSKSAHAGYSVCLSILLNLFWSVP